MSSVLGHAASTIGLCAFVARRATLLARTVDSGPLSLESLPASLRSDND